jgi:energy-coupling factor transporter ATP-binding protein EcfA2
MLKLRRLRVEKFRSVAKPAELSFSDGINVLLGQNGTGKTTLLELISMVVRSDFSSLAKEEFALEYELAPSEGESIVVAIRNERAAVEQPETPFDLGAPEAFRPSAEVLSGADRSIVIKYDAEHGITVAHQSPLGPARSRSCLDPGFLYFGVVLAPTIGDPVEADLLNVGTAHRFDESLDMFKEITCAGDITVAIFFAGQGTWASHPFVPAFVPDDVMKQVGATYESDKSDYSFTHNELSLLATIKDMMGFSSSSLRVDVIGRSHVSGRGKNAPSSIHLGNLMFRFWWEDGTFITHDRLSYGQKRLLTFFYYLACNPAIVIADELVNGLHHRWITASIEALGERQAFLTSQNPLLLDYLPITSTEQVKKSFVLCRGEPQEGKPGWLWANMTEDDAKELFSAYEVGVEHVSEILQSRGLW